MWKLEAGDPGGGYSNQRRRNEGTEGFGRHHEGVTECAEVCAVVHFFGEDIAWVDGTRDVVEVHLLALDAVADGEGLEADVAHALGGGALGPVNGALVIVVQTSRSVGVGEVHVITPVSEREDFLDSLVRGADFSFAGGATCARLADGFPGDGAAAAHDEKAAHGAVFEHLNFHPVING